MALGPQNVKPAEAKAFLRRLYGFRRRALSAAARASASRRVCRRLAALPAFRRARIIAFFWPFASEVDLRAAIKAAWKGGKTVLLPVTDRGFARPAFRVFRPGDALTPTAAGPLEPGKGPDFPAARIDLVVVPGLAFDRRGARLGYGGGVYDRLIRAARRARTVGVFFSAQESLRLPLEPHDRRLGAAVTERETVSF